MAGILSLGPLQLGSSHNKIPTLWITDAYSLQKKTLAGAVVAVLA